MSIKPLDFQVMLPKTQEVAKIHSDTQNKGTSIGAEQAANVKNDADQKVSYVHSRDKAENASIKEKQEKNNQENKKNKKPKKCNYSKDKKQSNGDTGTFDVIV